MADSPLPSINLEENLSLIEKALKLDERMQAIEAAIVSKKSVAPPSPPWWRNSKTITLLVALIAAVIPLVTAINGYQKNARELQLATIEQQNKIRQTYLDRVLKSGITKDEERRLFRLLSTFKSDPELQQWSKDQYEQVDKEYHDLEKALADLEAQKKVLLDQLGAEKDSIIKNSKKPQSRAKIEQLARDVVQTQQKIAETKARTGSFSSFLPDAYTTLTIHEAGHSLDEVNAQILNSIINRFQTLDTPKQNSSPEINGNRSTCTCPNILGTEISCEKNQIAVCSENDGKCVGRCVTKQN